MTVIVNEKKITLKEREDAPVTVTDLLKEMNVPEKGTAVAVNNRMVRRDDWAGHKCRRRQGASYQGGIWRLISRWWR